MNENRHDTSSIMMMIMMMTTNSSNFCFLLFVCVYCIKSNIMQQVIWKKMFNRWLIVSCVCLCLFQMFGTTVHLDNKKKQKTLTDRNFHLHIFIPMNYMVDTLKGSCSFYVLLEHILMICNHHHNHHHKSCNRSLFACLSLHVMFHIWLDFINSFSKKNIWWWF